MAELRYLDETGDHKIIWDSEKEAEVEAAETSFDLLTEKGYNAFKVKKDGKAGKKITKFDPDAERIIMTPKLVGG